MSEILRRRRDELRGKIESFDGNDDVQVGDGTENIEARQREVKHLVKTIATLSAKLEGESAFRFLADLVADSALLLLSSSEIDTEVETLHNQITHLERDRERKDTEQVEDGRNIERQQKKVERYLTKRQLLTQRKDECNKNIRDLGVLPEEAFIETNAPSAKVRSHITRDRSLTHSVPFRSYQ